MYTQALEGYKKVLGEEATATFRPALHAMWNLASLCGRQQRVEEARLLYAKALSGYQQVVGDDHASCQALRDALATLSKEEVEVAAVVERRSGSVDSQLRTIAESGTRHEVSISRGRQMLKRLGWKRTKGSG